MALLHRSTRDAADGGDSDGDGGGGGGGARGRSGGHEGGPVSAPAREKGPHSTASRRAMRTIALFEAFKAALVVAATLGLFSLLHHDLHQIAVDLIGHFGLSPGDRYPSLLLHEADLIENTDRRMLALLALAYVGVRGAEAYGLWNDRLWGQWLGAVSGAVYVPFELWHLIHRPTVTNVLVLLANLVIVAFLVYQLWRERKMG